MMKETLTLLTYSCYDHNIVIWSKSGYNNYPRVCSKSTEDNGYDEKKDLHANQWRSEVRISSLGSWYRMHHDDDLRVNIEEPTMS